MWKQIEGYEGIYEVSTTGEVKALQGRFNAKYKEKFLKPNLVCGYLQVSLTDNNGIRSTHLVHRLVATAWIHNPDKKKFVNHKNGTKTDNNIYNLEWVTHQENITHAKDNNLLRHEFGQGSRNFKGAVLAYTKDGVLVDTLYGAQDMRDKGYSSSAIYNCLNGRARTHKGLTFVRAVQD